MIIENDKYIASLTKVDVEISEFDEIVLSIIGVATIRKK